MLFGYILLPLLTLAIAESKGKPQHKPIPCHETSDSHHCPPEPRWPDEQISPVGQNLYRFYFEGTEKPAKQNFLFYVTQPFLNVTVWDCHCAGDQFAVFDQGTWIANIDQDCQGANSQCNFQHDDPFFCFFAEGFCKNNVTLSTGFHNLTFVPITNYYGQGYAYLQSQNLSK